jgi:hypothetical protein
MVRAAAKWLNQDNQDFQDFQDNQDFQYNQDFQDKQDFLALGIGLRWCAQQPNG